MSVNTSDKDRRDWTIFIILLPIGIILMLVVGQIAIRILPFWQVTGGMESSLDPDTASGNQPLMFQPLSFEILTPMSWLESFLTPGPGSANQDISFPPFVIFEPSATPSPIVSPTLSNTPPTPTTSATSSASPTTTNTWSPPRQDGGSPSPPPPSTCNDPAATNFGGPLPCTYPPTTCTDPTATNFGGPLPCTYPPTTCTDPAANNNGGPLPCIYPVASPLVGTDLGSAPANFNGQGAPNGAPVGNVTDGRYFIVTLSPTLVVNGPADTNYDLAYYELANSPGIHMDRVILSISMDDIDYYVVFNWGDGVPDTNSNVGDVAQSTGTEIDNQPIDASELYASNGQDTGVLIDVDNAPSNPPAGNYSYLAIQAPSPGSSDGADVDSVEIVDIAP